MNLDDVATFSELDSYNMLAQIDSLPDQLETAYRLGQRLPLPDMPGLKAVYLAGMGGSAIAADLLSASLCSSCAVPLVVGRGYDLPAWVKGSQVLVVLCSHSGNTEETLSAFEAAQAHGCRVLAVTTGGKLGQAVERAGGALWMFAHGHAPRAAIGYMYGLTHSALFRLGLVEDPSGALSDTLQTLHGVQANLVGQAPVNQNPAKRLAGQLLGRSVVVFGADLLAPVARRWKGQINELAKTWAQSEEIPEADHNLLAGLENPETSLTRILALFLRASANHPRNQLRLDLTREMFMEQGLNTDILDSRGRTPMAQQWSTLLFGDYTAYYLAMAYGVDPTPVPALEYLKSTLAEA
jgi:glucose/mannose-6-phosphate isomerase